MGEGVSDCRFVVERDSSYFAFEGDGVEHKLSLQQDPQTKLHQFQATTCELSTESAKLLKACVEDDDNKNLSPGQKLWLKLYCKLGHHNFKQFSF